MMFSRIFVVCSCLLILCGCVYNEEPVPEIVRSQAGEVSRTLLVPPRSPIPDVGADITKVWLPRPQAEKGWTVIIIHHSATESGNAAIFDKWHRENNRWEGVGYDFVIGNGTDSSDGQVEVTYRWRNQETGAHCGGTAGNWANVDGIGICLVGNFNRTVPTAQQMQSLVKLVQFLQSRYEIPRNRIYGHGTTPGARITDCPGKNFPMAKFKSMLNF